MIGVSFVDTLEIDGDARKLCRAVLETYLSYNASYATSQCVAHSDYGAAFVSRAPTALVYGSLTPPSETGSTVDLAARLTTALTDLGFFTLSQGACSFVTVGPPSNGTGGIVLSGVLVFVMLFLSVFFWR